MSGDAEAAAPAPAEHDGLRHVDLTRTVFGPGAASLLPEETARRYRVVPIERTRDATVVAVAHPTDLEAVEGVRRVVRGDVVVVAAPLDQVDAAISRLYGLGPLRTSRGRGQHAAQGGAESAVESADDPFQRPPFASADALLAQAISSVPPIAHEDVPERTPTSLEEALRDVLAPPEVDHRSPPLPSPPQFARDEGPQMPSPVDGAGDGALPGARAGTPPSASPGATNGSAPSSALPASEPPASALPASALPVSEPSASALPASAPPVSEPSASAPAPAPVTDRPQGADNGHAGASPDLAPNGHAPAGPAPAGPAPAGPAPAGPAPAGPASAGPAPTPAIPASRGGSVPPPTVDDGRAPAPEVTADEVPASEGAASANGTAGVLHEAAAPGVAPDPPAVLPTASPAAPAAAPPAALPAPPPGYGQVPAVPPPVAGADLHWPPLARVLVTLGRVSYDDMVGALRAHRETGESLARYLYNQQLATEDDLVQAMAEEVGLEFIDLAGFPVDPGAASLIPDAVARRHTVLPIRVEHGVPVVAMANPTDVFAMDDLRSIMGRNFTPVVATRSQILAHLRTLQETDSDVEEAAQSAAGTMGPGAGGGFELESLQSVVEDAPIVRYVNLLILQALNERASDIHIEPTPRRLRIRFRIDGVMHDASSASPAIHQPVVSRLKVLGEMDITEHRIPQEGRVSVSVGDRQIDLRLAMIPSLYGETCVMRLLDKSASIRRLPDLGFLPDTLERYAQTYNHPYGVILVTGPTGAGKTTTLYATLHEVMSKEKSVVTVEDPVEYQIDGITQVQINPKAGLQFSTALRSILRADPDIVLVGEIRDIDTATIAMEAALSGHLVLTTLHTNTAAATPLRLTEMGIEPFLVTSAVGGVLTQRLARVLCDRCRTPYDASLTDFYAAGYREVDLEGLDTSTLYRANGCRSCSHTGYHGRMVLAEVMQVTEEIERMIIEQQSIVAMERQAVEQGMRTLRQDGLLKAISGMTTLEEVLRVVV
jgi:type IV pilus assembly protein PilB